LNDISKQTGKQFAQVLPAAMRQFFAAASAVLMLTLANSPAAQESTSMMIRMSEIQVAANQLDQYKGILAEEAQASVQLEPGVIAIFPMYEKDGDTKFRILEIYADRQAYEMHLKTPHFQKYKKLTLPMVESLKLIDMQAIDTQTIKSMFKKMGGAAK
jgi:quinol monooxygenase YgiN